MNSILNTSTTISLYKRLNGYYGQITKEIIGMYKNSEFFKLKRWLDGEAKASFEHSRINLFFKKITTIKADSLFLDNSCFARSLLISYQRLQGRIAYVLNASKVAGLIKKSKEMPRLLSLETISIIIISAIFMNIVLSFAFCREIYFWNWAIYGLFLSLGIPALFCKADWKTIKKGSIFLQIVKVGQNGA